MNYVVQKFETHLINTRRSVSEGVLQGAWIIGMVRGDLMAFKAC